MQFKIRRRCIIHRYRPSAAKTPKLFLDAYYAFKYCAIALIGIIIAVLMLALGI